MCYCLQDTVSMSDPFMCIPLVIHDTLRVRYVFWNVFDTTSLINGIDTSSE